MITETQRLYLRKITQADYAVIAKILQDDEAMFAYNGAFSDEAVAQWFDNLMTQYQTRGFSLWAVVLKETDQVIGQCGLTLQEVQVETVTEIGYLFDRDYWHQGYAIEAAQACKAYAFDVLGVERVYSLIRETNISSMNVAIRNGMTVRARIIRTRRGAELFYYAFAVDKS
jgi:[ribosomal protein S5]-alanine N-acetyltransferase